MVWFLMDIQHAGNFRLTVVIAHAAQNPERGTATGLRMRILQVPPSVEGGAGLVFEDAEEEITSKATGNWNLATEIWQLKSGYWTD